RTTLCESAPPVRSRSPLTRVSARTSRSRRFPVRRETSRTDDLILDPQRLPRPVEVPLDARSPRAALCLAKGGIAEVAEHLRGEPLDVGRGTANQAARGSLPQ